MRRLSLVANANVTLAIDSHRLKELLTPFTGIGRKRSNLGEVTAGTGRAGLNLHQRHI